VDVTTDDQNPSFIHQISETVSFSLESGKSNCRGRLNVVVDLLELNSLDRSAQFYIRNIIYLFYNTSYLNEEVNSVEPIPFNLYSQLESFAEFRWR
jgi:hypothetical protein